MTIEKKAAAAKKPSAAAKAEKPTKDGEISDRELDKVSGGISIPKEQDGSSGKLMPS